MSDSISDMLTRIRNAQLGRLVFVIVPFSKMIRDILKVLQEEGYIDSYELQTGQNHIDEIRVRLKYSSMGVPVIQVIQKVSKPGQRIYSSIKRLKSFYNGMGIYILSTSKGIISDRKARLLGVGGEVIGKVF